MKRRSQIALLLILLSSGVSLLLGLAISRASVPGGIVDFQVFYYGTKCVIRGCDPYQISELRSEFSAAQQKLPGAVDPANAIELFDNLPTVFVLVFPFTVLPWWTALTIWVALLFGSMVLASVLMWSVGSKYAPGRTILLLFILLSNMEIGLALGNAGVLVVGLSVIAVWCFLYERFLPIAVLFLAVCLLSKPHDAGLVWLYLVLSGGIRRKYALLSLSLTAALGLVAFLWISHAAPNWFQEWRANMAVISAHGQLNDPGPDALRHGIVIDLQAVLSVFRDKAGFYNTVTFLVCGALLLVWALITLRYPFSRNRAWFALAAVVPLTMLITYHRLYDAKLFLLTIPACSILCSRRGRLGWTAFSLNLTGFLLAGDIPFTLFQNLAEKMHVYAPGVMHTLWLLLLTRQVSLISLAMAIFYLWVYVPYAGEDNLPTFEPRSGV